jgi:hypothetical protein
MRFSEWVEEQPRGTLKQIERTTGVGYTTLQRLRAGERLSRYDLAKKISDATDGAVTVDEICSESTTPEAA